MTLQELLKSLGIADDIINDIISKLKKEKIELHDNIVNDDDNKWIPKSRLDTVIEQRNEFEVSNKELQKTIQKLQKSVTTSEEDKLLIQQLQDQLEQSTDKIRELKVNSAVKDVALKYKAKDVNDILRFLDTNKIDVENVDAIEQEIKTLSETKAYLFGADKLGGRDPHVKDDKDTNIGITKEQFAKMTYKERVKLANEKPEVYDKLQNKL